MFDMRRREFITLLGGAAAAWPLGARAQQPGKLPIIGILGLASAAAAAPYVNAVRVGLRDLGLASVPVTTVTRQGPSDVVTSNSIFWTPVGQ